MNNFGWSEGQLHTTADTDWLANATDDTSREAMAARVAGQAKAWFQRLPAIVLSDRGEFRIQANAEGQRVAAPYDLQRDEARAIFVRSAERLLRLAEEEQADEDEAEDTSEEAEDAPAEDEEALFEEKPAEESKETSEETDSDSETSEELAEDDTESDEAESEPEQKEGRRRVRTARRRTVGRQRRAASASWEDTIRTYIRQFAEPQNYGWDPNLSDAEIASLAAEIAEQVGGEPSAGEVHEYFEDYGVLEQWAGRRTARRRTSRRRTAGESVEVASLPNCDLCGQEAHYDAKTQMGPWANLCELCFAQYGPGRLGTGYGQRLVVKSSRRRTAVRATPSDSGCWIDGHWGQYASVRLCEIAEAHGAPEFLSYGVDEAMSMDPADRDEWEVEAAEDAEEWLNANVAPEGYFFGWNDGEFWLLPEEQWGDDGIIYEARRRIARRRTASTSLVVDGVDLSDVDWDDPLLIAELAERYVDAYYENAPTATPRPLGIGKSTEWAHEVAMVYSEKYRSTRPATAKRRRTAASNLPPGVSDYDIPGVGPEGEYEANQFYVDGIVADEGTVVVFSGYDPTTGSPVTITVDHRMAQAIADGLEYNDVLVEAEDWQVRRMAKRRTAHRRTALNVGGVDWEVTETRFMESVSGTPSTEYNAKHKSGLELTVVVEYRHNESMTPVSVSYNVWDKYTQDSRFSADIPVVDFANLQVLVNQAMLSAVAEADAWADEDGYPGPALNQPRLSARRRRTAGGAFPGAGAQVYYNEDGEPLGWDYPSDEPDYEAQEERWENEERKYNYLVDWYYSDFQDLVEQFYAEGYSFRFDWEELLNQYIEEYQDSGDDLAKMEKFLQGKATKTASRRTSRRRAPRRKTAGVTTTPFGGSGYGGMGSLWGSKVFLDGVEIGEYSQYVHFDGDASSYYTPESYVTGQSGPSMSPEDAVQWIVEQAGGQRTARRRTAMPNPVDLGVKVGDIFYSSWGYDQTNVDFYEVVGLTGASVKVREVAQERLSSDNYGSDQVVPVPGDYIGEVMTKRISDASHFGETASIKISQSRFAYLWDGTPRRQTSMGWGH